jgi:hypothetical protein
MEIEGITSSAFKAFFTLKANKAHKASVYQSKTKNKNSFFRLSAKPPTFSPALRDFHQRMKAKLNNKFLSLGTCAFNNNEAFRYSNNKIVGTNGRRKSSKIKILIFLCRENCSSMKTFQF